MATAHKLEAVEGTDNTQKKVPREHIADRESQELVVAFAGPIGSGTDIVRERLKQVLTNAGYNVHVIKISDYLKSALQESLIKLPDQEIKTDGVERYVQMQDAGNLLRKVQTDILAEHAIKTIAEIRTSSIPDDIEDLNDYKPSRNAYLIDQLKHPHEVSLLRTVYGNLFYLFGVLSSASRRANRLKEQGIPSDQISFLMERDKSEKVGHGQQLDKALQLADFFLRNDHANAESLENQLKRFVDMIHGINGISPTKEEYGMYVAFAAGMRSSCLSRIVGASIMDPNGSIISTGRNDVPKATGGLYGPEDAENDARCIKLENAHCFNSVYKNNLKSDIEKLIQAKLAEITTENEELKEAIPNSLAKNIADQIHDETRVGSLIEFSRSIHAEMDAITSLARLGGGSTEKATLFTSTFPCHNCARHIVAAGISTVYYLEPYEKSLAKKLHWDSIESEGDSTGSNLNTSKVNFLHFEGVAPRQYLNIFNNEKSRKNDDGTAILTSSNQSSKKTPEYLDNYRDYELKVTQHYQTIIDELKN